MKYARNIVLLLALIAFVVGCTSLYTSTVTITKVVDTSMKAWADLSNTGHTTPAFDVKVKLAHARYKQLATIAANALKTYKETGGDPANANAAFEAVRQAALELIDLLQELIPTQAAKAKAELTNAKTL